MNCFACCSCRFLLAQVLDLAGLYPESLQVSKKASPVRAVQLVPKGKPALAGFGHRIMWPNQCILLLGRAYVFVGVAKELVDAGVNDRRNAIHKDHHLVLEIWQTLEICKTSTSHSLGYFHQQSVSTACFH